MTAYDYVDLDFFVEKTFDLTGAVTSVEADASGEYSINVVTFKLDGVAYCAREDPSDGYRSMLANIEVLGDVSVANTFPACRVRAERSANSHSDDCVVFIDVLTGQVVLEVGTHNADDYYPCFVGHFAPESMAINQPGAAFAFAPPRENVPEREPEPEPEPAPALVPTHYGNW